MIDFLILSFGLVGQWLLGVGLAVALLGRNDLATPSGAREGFLIRRAELIGLGLVLGICGTAYGQFLWTLLGGELGRATSIGFAIAGYVCGLTALRGCRQHNGDSLKQATSGSSLSRAAAWLIGLLFVSLLLGTLLTPQRLWDERAIYGIKAAVLFEDRSIDSPVLSDPDFVQYHPRYPLLLPLSEQHIYALLGRVDDRWSKLLFPLMSFGLVLTFAGVLQRQIQPGRAWLFAAMLATSPVLFFDDYGFLSAQADAPIACLHGISVLYLWDWLRRGELSKNRSSRGLLLAAVAAAMTVFTKNEGIAFFVVDAGLLAALTFFSNGGALPRRSRCQRFLAAVISAVVFAGIVIVLTAPWFGHRDRLPFTTEENYDGRLSLTMLWAGMVRLTWAIPHLLERMFLQAGALGLQWWGVLLACASDIRRALRPSQLLLLGDLAGAIAALLVVSTITPTPIEQLLEVVSNRYLMQLVPVAILFMAGQWGAGESAAEGK